VTARLRSSLAELDASWRSCPDGSRSSTTIELAGLVLRIDGAGSLPARLLAALSHHPLSSADPDLTIRVWDLDIADLRPHVAAELFHVNGDLNMAEGSGEVRWRYDWPQAVLQAWDSEAGIAWWCAERADRLEWWEEAAPFRPVLAWWLTSQQRYLAHGAALSVAGRAALLVGPGGSGKSTTALRAKRAGLGYLGDDYCIVARSDAGMGETRDTGSRYQVASLYRTVKLRPVDGGAAESELTRHDGGRKIVLSLADSVGGPLVPIADLVVVASLTVGEGAETTVESGHTGEVLTSLAPTSIEQLPGVGGASLPAFAAMLRELPTAVVTLGSDPDGVLAAVRGLIEALA